MRSRSSSTRSTGRCETSRNRPLGSSRSPRVVARISALVAGASGNRESAEAEALAAAETRFAAQLLGQAFHQRARIDQVEARAVRAPPRNRRGGESRERLGSMIPVILR